MLSLREFLEEYFLYLHKWIRSTCCLISLDNVTCSLHVSTSAHIHVSRWRRERVPQISQLAATLEWKWPHGKCQSFGILRRYIIQDNTQVVPHFSGTRLPRLRSGWTTLMSPTPHSNHLCCPIPGLSDPTAAWSLPGWKIPERPWRQTGMLSTSPRKKGLCGLCNDDNKSWALWVALDVWEHRPPQGDTRTSWSKLLPFHHLCETHLTCSIGHCVRSRKGECPPDYLTHWGGYLDMLVE